MSFLGRVRALFGRGSGNGGPGAIGCHDALQLVQEFLDGELVGVSRAEVEAHLEVCAKCYPHLRLERCFRQAVQRAAGGEAAPPELRARIGELIAEARADD